MNPRALSPYKILAVAALSTGCASPPRAEAPLASPPSPEAPAAPLAPLARPDTAAVALPSGANDVPPSPPAVPTAAATSNDGTSPALPRGEPDPTLIALREELETDRDALTRVVHYRPLCDSRGYPLVGNLIRKGPPPAVQPSALCAGVRARSARR